MTDGIRQFKINGKQVELSNEKKSASRDLYAQDAQLNSIFEKLNKADANGNIDDVLDEKEIKDFQQKIIDAAGKDGDLSSEEAKSLLESMGLKDIDTNKFFGFIQSMFSKEDAKVKEEVSDAVEQPQESEVGEDEQVTKGIIVQNGESPAAIAKKFGVPLQDLLDANKDALKGKGDKKYFLVGQEIVIPRKIDDEELATLNAGRKSAEETTGDYAQQAAVREQRAAEARQLRAQEEAELKELGMTERAKGEVKAHYSKTPNKPITLKKVANAKNGRSICVDKNGNYVVVAQNGTILKTDFVKNPEKYEQARKLNEEVKTRNTAKGIAKEFYQIADNYSGLNSINRMQKLLDTKVSAKNITQFLDEYDKFKQGDSSIIDTITSEVGASGTIQQKKVLTTLMDKLSQAARQAGVSEAEIKKANADFLKAYNVEYKSTSGAFRRTNPKDMEKAMDSLRGNILAKQNGTGDVDSAEAIKQFKDLARNEHNSAVKDFNKAREEEGWTAKVGDTVCGWFGCNTIEDLNKKLGANGAAVKKLINSKTEAEFKTNYKEIFGVEFDANKISARQNAIEKYSFALNCDNTVKAADKVLKHSDSWGYSDIKTAIRNNFKYDNATIDQIIENYAQSKGIQNPTDADKKTILVQFLNDTKTNARREFTNIAQGKSLDQMGKDIELITRSAFGTNDIVKDVIQFNENQQITEMVTEAGFEIAGTIALQFVPGLGQMAAARLAVSAARWGTKAVKVVNYAKKAEKVFSTVNKFQKGEAIANATSRTARVVNKGVQIGSQMLNTGVATATVDLSNGKSVKETTKKALMNMSFAGVGASSSILAPKLMQAFGIADKALATEIAEEIINAAGSYGVTKLEGGEYGSTDAFVDFASGLIISRISHVGGSKPTIKPQGARTPDVPTAPKVETPITPAPKAKPETVKAEVKPNETPEVVVKPNPEVKPEPVVATSKEVISDEVIPIPVKTVDETPVTPTPKKEVAIDEVAQTPVKTSDEVPPSPVKVDDKVPTPEVETPVTPQPKYTKEFEPAHNDTPVSSEIIDQRLGADNHELKDMGEYYRDLETREFEPHYEKREVSAKTIDEQFENPELKKLNEEFASGNSMLQKQATVENAIENLSYQNYSPEYVESIREKIKEISVGNPEMEKSYNELLDLAAHDASTERASLIREKEYIDRTYGTHKSAQESAEIFSDHLEQVNAAKEDDYIKRTHQNPSGKSAVESAEVFEKELVVRDKVKATDEQLHKRTLLDGDELFERITHSDNPELQKLGAQYKKLEAQQEELQQQVERLKEQIRRKAQTSAAEIDAKFNRSNPELDIMNTRYRSLEAQQEKLRAKVEKLKQKMREKVSVSADDIDTRLNQRTGDYEDLAADLRNREAVGQRAKKELELEKAEQAAAQQEQAYIDRTYNATHKSASESARVFEESFIKEQIQGIESSIENISISKAGSLDIYTLKQQIDALTDTSLRNKYKQILDTKLASFDDNLTRQRAIKEKLEEYQKAYAADDAAYRKAHDDGSYYSTKPDGFSYWTSSDKVKRELDELLGYNKNSRATFYAEELLDASKTGYIDDGSIAYPFLASKTLSSTTPYEWKGMCHTIEFSKRIKSGEHINPYEVVDVLKNLDRPIYNQRIKDEIKNIYGLDLDSYRSSLVDWLDNEYSNSLTIQIPKEEKTKLVHNVLSNKKPISATTAEIKSELEKAIPILKDNPKIEVIAKELKELENNPEFNKLDDLHKTIAKWSIITQDMRFRETAAVLREYNMPSVVQDRIIYSTIQDSQALAAAMMHSGDLEMFSIIDKVKRNIDTSYKGVNIEEIKSNIARINDVNNQNFIFSNTPATSAIPTQTVTNHGRNYNVKFVDLGDSKVLNNLEDYGFLPGTTPDDLEFVVHMFGHGKEEDNLTRLYNATKNKESVVLSTSLTNGYNRLYDHGNIGVVVDYNQNSVLDAFNEDLVSGRDKGHYQAQWAHKIWSDTSGRTKGQEYSLVKNELKNKLGLNDSEYLELTTYLRNKRSLGQITDIKIGDRKLSGTDIQKALKESQKKLFTGHEGYNEIELFNPSIKAIYLRDVEIADVPSYIFEYAQKHNLPIIHQPKMKNIITVQQAKLQCHDDNLIALATRKDGSVNKDALDVAMKYKELSGCNNDDIEFLLEQCNGNYKKVNELMARIKPELDKLDFEITNGAIGFKGLKIGESPDMDGKQFIEKYGDDIPNMRENLQHRCYRVDDLMNFYLFGKGKYIDSFNSGNIMKDFDVAYGCRSVTDGYHVRYTIIHEKEDEIASLIASSLSSQPTPIQRYALGCYKGDMSDSIQNGRMIKEGNYIEEYLSSNPLKKSIKVKREDSYAILSNLKFADGVTLKDAITNPQYYDRLSQIKSLEGQSFINDKFMSTTVGRGAFGNCDVNWDFEVGEGVGATYLDILGLASEGELLLNRGLKVTITEIEDTTPKGVVHIKAKVEKAD